MEKRFELYVIRHAQSANNALPESERVEDPPITERGMQQARLLANRFVDLPITHTLTSAFLRAAQTMQPLANAVGVPPHIWTNLHEVGGCFHGYKPGELEGRPGMSRTSLQSRFPDFIVPDDIDEQGWWKCRAFENQDAAVKRARTQAERLKREFAGTDAVVACVIHADFKDLLLHALLGSEFTPYRSADLQNTGVTHLSCSANSAKLVDFNSVTHLSDDLVSS